MKEILEKLFTFFFLTIISLLFFAANASAERLPVKIYTSADGLGSGFVDFLMRDSRGFMWFCTRDGLSRFDGARFVTYQIGSKDSPPGIESIYETRDGMYLQKSREVRFAKLEKVRSRLATDLHDDIGASLTQIAILSEVVQAQSTNGVSEPLKAISSVSNELVGTMSDIVWSINPAKDHLRDLTQRMRRFASDVLSAKGIGLHFDAPDADKEIIIGTNLRREVFLIFKETVNNIVKHSGARQVQIELKISGEELILEISDDGKGFALSETAASTNGSLTNDKAGGNGILSIRRRASEMNGELTIGSEIGKGTTVTLRLPLDTAAQAGGVVKIETS